MAFLDETGLTHLWGKITNKFLAKSNVANNLTTTSEGYALDARQGAAITAAIAAAGGGNLKVSSYSTITNISSTITANSDGIVFIQYEFTANAFTDGITITIHTKIKDTVFSFEKPITKGATKKYYDSEFHIIPVKKGDVISFSADSTGQSQYSFTPNFGYYIVMFD